MQAVVYKGKNKGEKGTVFGHQNQGTVEDIGKGVVSIKKGDRVPGKAGDEFGDDFVLLADIFPTGWHATELAKVKSGDSVAVFGAGPVGLLSAYSACIRGAAEVYVVDLGADQRYAR